jgi:hypothetical protein
MRKRSFFNFFTFFPFAKEYHKLTSLKQKYLDTLDQINLTKEKSLLLLKRITGTASLSQDMKEKLINQTLLKFKDFTESIIEDFANA